MKYVEMIRAHCVAAQRHALQRTRQYVASLNGGQPEIVDLLTGESGLHVLESTVEHVMACLGETTELTADDTAKGSSATRRAVRKGIRTRGARAHQVSAESE